MHALESRVLLDGAGDAIAPVYLGSDVVQAATTAPLITLEEQEEAETDGPASVFDEATDLGVLDEFTTANGFVGGIDPLDVYRFEVLGESEVDLSLGLLTADLDMYIFDAGHDLIGQSIEPANQGENWHATLAPGTYFVIVAPYRFAFSSYRLVLQAEERDPAGNKPADAWDTGELIGSMTFDERVSPDDRADYYRFFVSGPTEVTLQLTGLADDLDMHLIGADGSILASSINASNDDEAINFDAEPGEYLVFVHPWGRAASNYTLTLTGRPETDLTEPEPAPPDEFEPIEPPVGPVEPIVPIQPDDSPLPPATEPPPLFSFPDVADSTNPNDWNFDAINAPEVWAQGYTGDGVVVAVIDTGVDLDHPDLAGSLWHNEDEIAGNGIDDDANGYVDDLWGWDYIESDGLPYDAHGHGTHVAGIITANANGFGSTGVAFDAEVMALRALDEEGNGLVDDVAAAIVYAVDNGAAVINLSLGGPYSPTVDAAARYARDAGVLIVAAAGNEAEDSPIFPATLSGLLNNVISVGSHDEDDTLSWFSNTAGESGALQVNAPGGGVYSTLPGGEFLTLAGTSMATPHVAALAALALSARPDLGAAQLRDLIIGGADRPIDGDTAGGINATSTLSLALGTSPVEGPLLLQPDLGPQLGRSPNLVTGSIELGPGDAGVIRFGGIMRLLSSAPGHTTLRLVGWV